MTQQYAVGDKVRIIDGRGFVEDGTVTTVKSLDTALNGDAAVYLDALNNAGCPTWLRTKYIEKVAEQMTKFNVGDTVRAITDKYGMTTKSAGWEGVVTEVAGGKFDAKTTKGKYSTVDFVYYGLSVEDFELVNAKSTQDKPKKKARISALEAQVAELTAKVEALESAQKPAITIDLTSKAKAVVERMKSPNEQRKAIIAEAKAFVEDALLAVVDGLGDYRLPNGNYVQFETIVNAEKRTVVVLAKSWISGKVRFKYTAKCAPDDVFNADIGKAIALGRALGLDVKQFEQAVKPTEITVGMSVKYADDKLTYAGETRKVTKVEGTKLRYSNGGNFRLDLGEDAPVIIDDTDAQY